MEKKTRKIGIMGGTFDPIHIGHLILGEGAYKQFGLSEVWFMPAGNPPHKQNRAGRATDEQRVEMIRRAIAGNPHFALCLEEMNADGFTYSYRTLEALNLRYPDTEFYFILGADSLFDFHKWREPDRICRACKIVVATRNQVSSEKLDEVIAQNEERFHGEFLKLDTPNLDISSGNIRERIREGQTIRYYLPDPVISYIFEHGIYGCAPESGQFDRPEEQRQEDAAVAGTQKLWSIDKKLRKELDENRYHHTLGVMFTAASMAMVWDVPLAQAQTAGLLHDCAKCIPNEKKISMCRKHHVPLTAFETAHPFLIHAKLGAYLAKKKYGIEVKEVLNAITWHTTGKPDMTKLEMIIYIADYIEPQRDKAPRLDVIRRLAFEDLEECMYQILKDSMSYLSANPEDLDRTTETAYQYYKKLHDSRKSEVKE